ncbi:MULTISPECIES: hypothetical protein [unclassified Pantoea]|uniref:hypothetical protein n=1 Tax=unclassified Pantoea TaxID=2630326 RepID=UPI00123239BF|nr:MULTISPECIES: hypothetical protein [unclassified Pantoea]KAA5932347.1 hypothetical protein F3I59_04785 [Pantoea sp. VH_8]KAA5937408.1 hypothetical protein F3I58_04815 [Pantoea sp. VH_4]
MKKLTAENCREQFEEWFADHAGQTVAWVKSQRASDTHYKIGPEIQRYWLTWQASRETLEIALPILEQQERGDVPERQDSLKHVGYLFVNSGGGVVYSPSGFGMRGFTCAGKIYGDLSFKPEQQENDGWIEWGGGECPVDKKQVVHLKFRDGKVDDDGNKAFIMRWSHIGTGWDIIAYRIIPEQPTNQNGEQ